MSAVQKPRVIKNYEKLDEETIQGIKLAYPEGFSQHLIRFRDVDGRLNSGLPFETDEKYYFIRMTKSEALLIIDDDDDYDDDGNLLDEARETYEDNLDVDEDDADIADADLLDPDDVGLEEE
ncbi:hypothetical protein [Lewinella sp. 4G2]|uniref:hypothetical protein n=1 Tax=Lewinella sp. 4G2 TaxID=1803372 RepID=UPI0007B4B1EB|nr:hypothetical protein [Lewinella sp. 4G2]OAV44938.1 hypothetical protein A3850_010720 [Lewinella sp. 4G2]